MLKELREKIRDVDRRIAELVAERLDLARDIGGIKAERGYPVRDFRVEREVFAHLHDLATRLGIDSKVLEEIGVSLVRESIRQQVQDRPIPPAEGSGNCCIIGGAGGMGRWFGRYLASRGYRIQVIEAKDEMTPVLSEVDLVVLAVPLAAMPKVLSEVLSHRPRGVILEIASLKTRLIEPVREGIASGLRIVSLHPMFGPETDLLFGCNLILCEAGCKEAEEKAFELFRDTAANIVRLPLEQHDRYMAWVLNLPHLVNLLFGVCLRSSGIPMETLHSVGGTTYLKQVKVTDEVMSENPRLYHQIQWLNEHRDRLFDAVAESLDRIRRATEWEDSEELSELMTSGSRFLRGGK